MPKGRNLAELRQELREKLAAQREIPSYLPRQVIYYTRFVDDFLVVLCNMSKEDAQRLKQSMANWLREA